MTLLPLRNEPSPCGARLRASRRACPGLDPGARALALSPRPAFETPPPFIPPPLAGEGREGASQHEDLSVCLVRAAHERRKLRIEPRGILVERRVADPVVDRELRSGNRLRRILG